MSNAQLLALLEYYFKHMNGALEVQYPVTSKEHGKVLDLHFYDTGGNYHHIGIEEDGALLTYPV